MCTLFAKDTKSDVMTAPQLLDEEISVSSSESTSSGSSSSPSTLSLLQLAEPDYHLKSSIISNVSFLVGSILYVKTSKIDLINSNYEDDYAYDDGYYDYDTKINNYRIINLVGALVFVFNASWDMYWCFGRERERKENSGEDDEEDEIYRVEEKRSFLSALAFGTAGSIDVVVSFYIENYKIAVILYIVSSHIYLLSAILTLRATTFSCHSIPAGLTLCGELLFALGSMIDVVISYISDPELSHLNDHTLAEWGCLSSVLWLIDACLYLFADATVIWYRRSCCCNVRKPIADHRISLI